jgi:hypothetical protein
MFQYAIGRYIAQLSNTSLSLDVLSYSSGRAYPFPFSLDKFFIQAERTRVPSTYIKEYGFEYDPNVLKRYKEDTILCGYWQDERYFSDVSEDILREFILKPEHMSDEYHAAAASLMEFVEPVFVHVRRGERVHNRTARGGHGLISEKYYVKAMDYIKYKRPNSTMLFFSDDPEYAHTVYGSKGYVIPSLNDYEHLSLMSLCDHAIIANSSFSWWGAWLIRNSEKLVVAPNKWTINADGSNKEIVPKNWKKLNPRYE